MPFDDLDLEFEDEEEAKQDKPEVVNLNEDLEFQTLGGTKPRLQSGPVPPEALVRKIEEARQSRPSENPGPQSVPITMVEGTSAVKREVVSESLKVESLKPEINFQEEMMKIQIDSQVKVSIAEFKVDFLSELLSDAKLMDHQIGQLLLRIQTKYPDTKNDVVMIKKIMAEFLAKKRK